MKVGSIDMAEGVPSIYSSSAIVLAVPEEHRIRELQPQVSCETISQ